MRMEKNKNKNNLPRRFILIIAVLVIVIVAGLIILYSRDYSYGREQKLGITFSKSYAEYLGLDWKDSYLALLDDLKIKNVRLIAQWDEVEPKFNQYYFDDLDWMLSEAKERDVRVIMTIGRRVPRWPECHDPVWLAKLEPNKARFEQLQMIKDAVKHFKVYDNIAIWQVENEPFLGTFGECPAMTTAQLKEEIAWVKTLDNRPILVTDSGELNSWFEIANLGDKFGHTLYREVYNKYIGYFHHVFPPAFYFYKAKLNQLSTNDVIAVEVQAEPWVPDNKDLKKDYESVLPRFPARLLKDNTSFASRTGASEIYLWGAEWWYFMKEKNHPEYWEMARGIFGK